MAHRLAEEAIADLDAIWLDVAQGSQSIDVADRLIDLLAGRFQVLAAHPYFGR